MASPQRVTLPPEARIAVLADWHAAPDSPLPGGLEADALVILAGDIANDGSDDTVQVLRHLQREPARLAVLAGNHDLWSVERPDAPTSQEAWDRLLPAAARARPGDCWLEDAIVHRGSLAIIGTIGWYDYQGGLSRAQLDPTWFAAHKGQFTNDARFLRGPWDDLAFAAACRAGIATRLALLADDPSVRDVVVVTHVPPFLWRRRLQAMDAYYAHIALGDLLREHPKVRLVVSGHTHRPQAWWVRGTHSAIRVRILAPGVVWPLTIPEAAPHPMW